MFWLSRNAERFGVDPGAVIVTICVVAGIAALIAAASVVMPFPWLRAAVVGVAFTALWLGISFSGNFLGLSPPELVVWIVLLLIAAALLAGWVERRLPQGAMLAVWLIVGAFVGYALWGGFVIIGLLIHPLTF